MNTYKIELGWLDKIEYEAIKSRQRFDDELLKTFPIGSLVHFRYRSNQKTPSRGTVQGISDGHICLLREKPGKHGYSTCKYVWWRNVTSSEFAIQQAAKTGGAR